MRSDRRKVILIVVGLLILWLVARRQTSVTHSISFDFTQLLNPGEFLYWDYSSGDFQRCTPNATLNGATVCGPLG